MAVKTMQIYVKDLIYYLPGDDGLIVLIGTSAYYDAKRKKYFEGSQENKFVASGKTASFTASFKFRCGDRYEVTAREEENKNYGYQWIISSAVCKESVAVSVIRQFLKELKVKGLTMKKIDKLLRVYNENTLTEILANSSALDILNPSPQLKNKLYTEVTSKQGFAHIMTFLEERRVDCRLAAPIFEQYGNNAVVSIASNPYSLFESEIARFRTADRIFLAGGGNPQDSFRSNYAVLAALHNESKQTGSVFIRRSELRKKIARLLADTPFNAAPESDECTLSEDNISAALLWLQKVSHVKLEGEAVYLQSLYQAEINVANTIKLLCETRKNINFDPKAVDAFLADFTTADGYHLSSAQREAVQKILSAPVSVVTGGPGTGKSTLISSAAAAVEMLQPRAKLTLCAPTGKAADNMPGDAKTIHKIIAMNSCRKRFEELENIDLVFVDEASMMDIQLCADLLAILPAEARLVLIGDSHQLPSIEAGQVLCDLIRSECICTINLHDGFRQKKEDSQIRSAAAKIIETGDEEDIVLDTVNISSESPAEEGKDCYFINGISSPDGITNCIVQAEKLLKEQGLTAEDIQVLTRQKQGELGTFHLNKLMQDAFNPQPEEHILCVNDKEFRLHDRVIHTRNNYDLQVFNGNVGVVTEIAKTREHALTVTYPSGAKRYSAKDLEDLELAYAMTIHKSQGSEYRAVIIPVAGKGFSRQLLYTGVTRGKELVLLIGTAAALTAQKRNEPALERNSRLIYRLRMMLPRLPEEEMEQQSLYLPVSV